MAQAANEPQLHDAQLQAFIPRSFKSGGVSYRIYRALGGWSTDGLGTPYGQGYSLQLKQKWLSAIVLNP